MTLVNIDFEVGTLLDATCWPRWMILEDVGIGLNILKIFIQHSATLLGQHCCAMFASFEPVNSKRTGTLTQYNNPYNRMKPG